jgi:hypothetical protein
MFLSNFVFIDSVFLRLFLGPSQLLNRICSAASSMPTVDKAVSAETTNSMSCNVSSPLSLMFSFWFQTTPLILSVRFVGTLFSIRACYMFDEMTTRNTVGKKNRTTHIW